MTAPSSFAQRRPDEYRLLCFLGRVTWSVVELFSRLLWAVWALVRRLLDLASPLP
jgi:hypothetical protein